MATIDPSIDLNWYCEKIKSQDPFSLLLFGDGEFLVAANQVTGEAFTEYREVVTPTMVEEMLAALYCPDEGVMKGTDINLIDYTNYKGQDAAAICEHGRKIEPLWKDKDITFLDGVVFDRAASSGGLAPLLRAIHTRDVIIVGDNLTCQFFAHANAVHIYPNNAYSDIDNITEQATKVIDFVRSTRPLVIVCAGLTAIPLIMRLRKRFPFGTFLDLGSTFDLFVGKGGQRGWRNELYHNLAKLRDTIEQHMAGVCGQDCGTYCVRSRLRGGTFYVEKGKVTWSSS